MLCGVMSLFSIPVRLILAAAFLCSPWVFSGEIAVSTDFPGGSGEVVSIDQAAATIVLNPTDHPGKGWRCWWYVKLTGLPLEGPVTLDVGEAPWATPDRATLSLDGGKTWRHSEPGVREGKRIRYSLEPGVESALVAWGPPFVPEDAADLTRKLAEGRAGMETFSLCLTREGHETPALRSRPVSERDGVLPLVWVNARQHAWESGASWVARGFGEWLVSEDPDAVRLREGAEVVLVPIMDIDNVRRGAGGKNQQPQDHNRDWTEEPHWHAVAAAQAELRAAAEAGRLAMFMDLHNPGAGDRFPYFYIPPRAELSEPAVRNLDRFLALAKEQMKGPLRFTGKTIESGQQYDPKAWSAISKNWVARLGTPAVSVTLETSWNTPSSTTAGYLTIGAELGRAMSRYLATAP